MHAKLLLSTDTKADPPTNVPLVRSLFPTCVTVGRVSVFWSVGSVDTCTDRHVRMRMFVNNNTIHHIGRHRAPPEANNGPL